MGVFIPYNRFYKYANYDITRRVVLPDQTLKFSAPEHFNDPFDCNEELLNIHMDERHLQDFAGEQLKKMPKNLRKYAIARLLDLKTVHEALKKEKPNFKICCFSTRCDDILMWSHYAEKHTGVCLGFEFPVRADIFTLYPVRYIDQIKKLHGMADVSTVFYYWLTRKPKCWEYENEIRAITRSGDDIIRFERRQLKEVIFGCRVNSDQIKELVEEVLALGFWDISFKRMVIDGDTFGLKSLDLKKTS